MNVTRFNENPLIKPSDVPPSRPDFEVVCAFNSAVTRYNGETILLMRVAERAISDDRYCRVPVVSNEGDTASIEVIDFDRTNPAIDCSDPRKVNTPSGVYLTTLSHLRIARSKDGINFTVDPHPAMLPDRQSEAFGLEDPRITEIDGTYYIAYKSVGAIGISVSLAETKDFITFEKKGIIFCPENLDVCIFPEKVNGRYVALHRPVSQNIASMNIWAAYSSDLLNWGDHQFVMGINPASWDSGRIGGSTIPIKTKHGWLEIYHGATPDDRYCLGAVLLDLDEPHKVIARGNEPIIFPEAPYETNGFLPNVIFSCGAVLDGDTLTVYYGSADECIAGAQFSVNEILATLVPEKVTVIAR